MVIFKCSCGVPIFIKDENIDNRMLKCQNCKNEFNNELVNTVSVLTRLNSGLNVKAYIFPDDILKDVIAEKLL